MDIVAARTLNTLYIYLDIVWLIVYGLILLWQKKYIAIISGLIGAMLYFAVDYGIFYCILKTRVVNGADPFWFLLWLSTSYGFTNFAWIWLLLDRDSNGIEWSILTIAGWIAVASLSQNFGNSFQMISIQRGTMDYHGTMALILLIGYLYLIIRNLRNGQKYKVNILYLLFIGIGVQLSWEIVLLVFNIRPQGIMPLIVNSLVETNMGMPYLYIIHNSVSKRFNIG